MSEDSENPFARFAQQCPAGTVLFREGDEGDVMFVVQSGKVAIRKMLKGGEKTLAILGAGEFFGEMALLNEVPRSASAEVVENAQLLRLDSKTFEQLVIGNKEISVRLIKRLARRLHAANNLIEIMTHRDPKARFILGLSRQADLVGEPQGDGSIRVPRSAAELATEVGLTPAEVTDVLKRLERLGIVTSDAEGVSIREQSRLTEFLEFLEMREQ